MSTASALASLLQVESDLNYYTQQQIWYANKHKDASAKVAAQVEYQEKWEDAYDSAMYNDKALKVNGVEVVSEGNTNETVAEKYADNKVQEYDEEILLELTSKDDMYDTMQEMYNTMCEELRAEKDKYTQLVSTEAQDTHLLGS